MTKQVGSIALVFSILTLIAMLAETVYGAGHSRLRGAVPPADITIERDLDHSPK